MGRLRLYSGAYLWGRRVQRELAVSVESEAAMAKCI